MIEIPENVNAFVEQCGDIVAAYHRQEFVYPMTPELVICDSPIEQLFLVAVLAILDVNELNDGEADVSHGTGIRYGVFVDQQAKIGNYRVDFRISYIRGEIINYDECKSVTAYPIKKIVVELDGHDFHDKDEKQRRYEKARDRFLQKKGYRVFHYTGSEIVKDPFAAAAECVSFLVEYDEDILMENIEKHRRNYVR